MTILQLHINTETVREQWETVTEREKLAQPRTARGGQNDIAVLCTKSTELTKPSSNTDAVQTEADTAFSTFFSTRRELRAVFR